MSKKKSYIYGDKVELLEWDKSLILRLVTNEYFGESPGSESSIPVYKCKQYCTVCTENKPNFPLGDRLLDKLFGGSDDEVVMSEEDREAINKDLIHDYFKKQWEEKNANRNITNDKKEKSEEKKQTKSPDASTQSTNKHDKPKILANNAINKIKTSLKDNLRMDKSSRKQDNSSNETEDGERYDFHNKNNITQYKEADRMKMGVTLDYDKTEKQTSYASYYSGTAVSKSYNSNSEYAKIERNQRTSIHSGKYQDSSDGSGADVYYSEEEAERFEPPVRNNSTSTKQTENFERNRTTEKYDDDDECYDVRYKYKTSKNNTHHKEGNRLKTTESAKDYGRNKIQFSCDTPSTSYNGKREETHSDRGRSISQTSKASSIRRKENRDSDYDTESDSYSEDDDYRNARNKSQALSKQNTRRYLPPNALSMNRPMDDPNSKFYIDKKWIDRNMYVKGLTKEKWNPTQSLYEIGTKCNWTRPDYIVTRVGSKNDIPQFTCEVIINGESFVTDHPVTQKKLAQHLASTKVLNYIGFDFRCPNFKQPAFVPKPLPRGDGAGPSRVAKFSIQMSSASWSLEEVPEYPTSPKRSKL